MADMHPAGMDSLSMGAFDFKRCCIEWSVYESTARAIREQVDSKLSNGSCGTLMSYTDRSMQHRLKSNAPNVKFAWFVQELPVFWCL